VTLIRVLFTPLLGVTLLPRTAAAVHASSTRLKTWFGRLLLPAMRFRWITIVAALVLFALSEGPQSGWGSGEVVVSGLAGLLMFAALIYDETRVPEPMLAFRLYRDRMFRNANILLTLTDFQTAPGLTAAMTAGGAMFGTPLPETTFISSAIKTFQEPWVPRPCRVLRDRVGMLTYFGPSYSSDIPIAARTLAIVSLAAFRAFAAPASRISQASRGFSSYFRRRS